MDTTTTDTIAEETADEYKVCGLYSFWPFICAVTCAVLVYAGSMAMIAIGVTWLYSNTTGKVRLFCLYIFHTRLVILRNLLASMRDLAEYCQVFYFHRLNLPSFNRKLLSGVQMAG